MGGNMTKVLPHLYIGGNENARDEGELIANCITHILTVQSTEAEINKLSKYEYLKVYVGKPASKCLLRVIPQTNDFIHAARMQSGNVLVHSESGMSANVAVVAAYLMTVYNLTSKVAVSTLQGLVPPAHPVTSLQNQLDRFDPETPGNIRGDAPISAASERERLLEKFGPWPQMETDQRLLKAALDAHDELKASGAFLISSGESRPRQRTPSPPPNTTAKFVLPKDKRTPSPPDPAYTNPDGEFRFDDAHGTSDKSDEDGFEHIPTSPEDSEKSLADEDAIIGSIPVPRPGVTGMSLIGHSVAGGGGSRTHVSNALTEKAAAAVDEGDMMFEMTDEIRIRLDAAAAAIDEHVPSTAPVYHDFTQRRRLSP
ncbi:Dual specificity protein phosphatase 22-B [Echinococcus granulosus]|uniref:Protein phosphatase n=2 Tax=Echinococcus granulosus TaxID=6210 RepID=A0A068WHB1_ECHGR|nr:Dual specificity protein phosphatase 22-B [Echinococcus granulosus]CDS17068.1 protein phosphatase [Echinococcus granulosus]